MKKIFMFHFFSVLFFSENAENAPNDNLKREIDIGSINFSFALPFLFEKF